MKVRTLEAGMVLYHGTAVALDEFDERVDALEAASFVSDSEEVARFFAGRSQRSGEEGVARVIAFRLPQPVSLPLIESRYEMDDFFELHGINPAGVEDMRDGILTSGQPGWLVAGNYPCGGADILLIDAGSLEFVSSEALTPEGRDLLEAQRAELDGGVELDGPGCAP